MIEKNLDTSNSANEASSLASQSVQGSVTRIKQSPDRKYRLTADQWEKIINQTEFTANDSFPWSAIELINFTTCKIHLKSGKRIPFDGLSESQYVWVCNGGYHEYAPEIGDILKELTKNI